VDPRNFTVKPCSTAYAGGSVAAIGSAISSRRDFGNSIGKIGDLAVLNSVGAGAIGAGLRTVASISNSIRTGCGSLPTTIGSSIDEGANWILSSIGIAPSFIQTLRSLNPSVANQAWGQAQQLFQQVQNGHFKASDIPSYLQDFQNLERLARGIYTPGDDRLNQISARCEASPYAVDLIRRAPKYKFLFVVQFVTASGYENLDPILRGMAFVIKKSTRPKITYQTEPVNFYNFRSKIITKTEFEEMNMTFHDDTLNNTTKFYTACMQAMSPITNLSPSQSPTGGSFEQMGMNFVDNTQQNQSGEVPISINNYAASTGPLSNDNKQNIFKEIILYHIFDSGTQATVYHFINPRITQLVPDDVDMSIGSEGCELALTFCYDSVFVETKSMAELDSTFRGAQSDALYQLRNNDSASSTQGPNSSGIAPYGPPATDPTNCNALKTTDNRGVPSVLIQNGGFSGGVPDLGDFVSTQR
jgi:hypothetical protein